MSADEAVTVVEWGEGKAEQLADSYLTITLERAEDGEQRTATVAAHGGDWATRLTPLR